MLYTYTLNKIRGRLEVSDRSFSTTLYDSRYREVLLEIPNRNSRALQTKERDILRVSVQIRKI